MKTCKCGARYQPVSEHQRRCPGCNAAYLREWRARNPGLNAHYCKRSRTRKALGDKNSTRGHTVKLANLAITEAHLAGILAEAGPSLDRMVLEEYHKLDEGGLANLTNSLRARLETLPDLGGLTDNPARVQQLVAVAESLPGSLLDERDDTSQKWWESFWELFRISDQDKAAVVQQIRKHAAAWQPQPAAQAEPAPAQPAPRAGNPARPGGQPAPDPQLDDLVGRFNDMMSRHSQTNDLIKQKLAELGPARPADKQPGAWEHARRHVQGEARLLQLLPVSEQLDLALERALRRALSGGTGCVASETLQDRFRSLAGTGAGLAARMGRHLQRRAPAAAGKLRDGLRAGRGFAADVLDRSGGRVRQQERAVAILNLRVAKLAVRLLAQHLRNRARVDAAV